MPSSKTRLSDTESARYGALAPIAAYSRYARMQFHAHPALAAEIARDRDGPVSEAAMREWLAFPDRAGSTDPRVGVGRDGDIGARLRDLRRRVMLGLMARDLGGAAPLSEVCATMTALAQASIDAALGVLVPELEASLGVPLSPTGERQELVVVGMGKLGGGELNVSSDIDLVFAYPEDGETRPGENGKSISNHEFFAALGRRLIALLAEPTEQGFVFRVDMRLRPWGEPGPLAMSFEALEQYLVAHGREWERYAWIKGRPLTGGRAALEGLAALVRPFVFRKYLDYGAYGAMRELHSQIREEVARRELAGNIKLGPGGIREIEFIAQVFQLVRGGREQELQARPTLQVLALLARRNLIAGEDAAALSAAYDFLRRLEHRLQYLDDAQTHELPEDAADRKRVAAAMGSAGWAGFTRILEKHRGAVARCFEKVFAAQDPARHAHPLAGAWSSADRVPALRDLGFADPEAAAARLAAMREGSRYRSLPEASRERVDALVPRLLEQAARRPDADATLARALDLIDTVSRRAAYLALLDEHPVALERLTELISASSWAAEYLNLHPVLLDELLDTRLLMAAPDWRACGQALRRTLINLRVQGDTGERQMDALREAHHAQLFHLLAQDLAGALSVEALADHLSDLADLMLQATLELCWLQILEQRRDTSPDLPAEPRFAVIAYGKLGGKELGYASDLDLVFLYDDGGPGDEGAAIEAYGRLAQRMNSWLNSRSGAGVLFETDLRLRPDGASGLMVSSMDAFRRYQRESAWMWEHQALTRARFCAGEATAGAAFEEERRHILGQQRDIANLAAEVRAMRKAMMEGHPNRSELFDLKHDRGGMVDIEFLVQFLVLAHAHRHPVLAQNDGNIALLGYAAELGLIEGSLAAQVQEAYRAYRRRQHALRLEGARYARVPREEVERHMAATLALWKVVMGEAEL